MTIAVISCKKERSEDIFIQDLEENLKVTDTEFPNQGFEHTIFKSNLRNLLSTSNLPDELTLNGEANITNQGISLATSSLCRMKYPSTLDRSQIIIDVLFNPLVTYKKANTLEEISLAQIKDQAIPFIATMNSVDTYVGKSLMSIAGSVFGFKVSNSGVRLELYRLTNGTSSSDVDKSESTTTADIPLNLFFGDVNKNYWEQFNLRFTITKNVNLNHLTVENLQTGAKIECFGKSKNQSNGCQWGYGFIRAEQSNTIKVQQFVYRSLDSFSPDVMFLGHSFIEGNSLAATPEGFDARYSSIIKASLGGNAVIAGMGGANTSNLISRLKMDLEPFSPKYVVVDCIANENSFSAWQANMSIIIKSIIDKKAVPILVTAAPRLGYEHVIAAANNHIRNSLGQKYLDLNDIVSENMSSTIWKANYGMPDAVHPTVMAHQKIALQLQKDIPELFND